MTRRAESDVELLASVARDLRDLRSTALARMAPRARLDVPVFQGGQAADQSLSSGVLTQVNLDAEPVIDTHGGHSVTANPNRWTVPTGWAGIYMVSGRVRVATAAADQVITCTLAVNNLAPAYATVNGFGSNTFSVATGAVCIAMEEGDFVQLGAAQYSGSSKSTVAAYCALAIAFLRR